MGKPHTTAKLVFVSLILSIIVVASCALVFINYLAPSMNINNEQIYKALSAIFPLLVGLILFEIGCIKGGRNSKKSKKIEERKIAEESVAAPAVEKIVEVEKFVDREVPVEVIKEVPVEVEKIVEVEKEVPVEVIKEIPVEVTKEIIKEYPVEIVREIVVEKLVGDPKPKEVYLDQDQVIEEEINFCKGCGSRVAVVLFKLSDSVNEDILNELYGKYGYVFKNGEDKIALLIPHATQNETEEIINSSVDRIPEACYAILSVESDKLTTGDALLKEADNLFI
ncbi:MAG: hypothetical protein IJ836_08625 [Spirochaetales bacterium]|nr:hypothetical protein [Spirochaetales bacterium]